LPIKTDSAGDAIDILIWGMQLELGPHATTYVPHYYDMYLGGGPEATGSHPAWIPAGLDFTANSGASFASTVDSQPIDLTTVTMYLDGVLVKTVAATLSPVQVSRLLLGNFNNAAYWPGLMGYASLYSAAHSDAAVATNTATLVALMRSRGVRTAGATDRWV